MNDSQKSHGTEPLAAFPGLQILGEESDAGACTDGICTLPGSSAHAPAVEKTD
ncbi:hypothetical protein FM104_06610 [Microbacterium esteraromaticum]|uniref:Uncharacterized protein n=1 Tax=Microbacterium esteraromaticum TaxID=57043 RepID=A0A1R4JC13_9MICO|nr:hypothetical protein [Microbacterium esteraromaticum]SJN29650.1 hypothetical protein FM104_06610 [Microbacterium esteraromaticum]